VVSEQKLESMEMPSCLRFIYTGKLFLAKTSAIQRRNYAASTPWAALGNRTQI